LRSRCSILRYKANPCCEACTLYELGEGNHCGIRESAYNVLTEADNYDDFVTGVHNMIILPDKAVEFEKMNKLNLT
jgi:hypothetical protein